MKKVICMGIHEGNKIMQRVYTRHKLNGKTIWKKTVYWMCPYCDHMTNDYALRDKKVNYHELKLDGFEEL